MSSAVAAVTAFALACGEGSVDVSRDDLNRDLAEVTAAELQEAMSAPVSDRGDLSTTLDESSSVGATSVTVEARKSLIVTETEILNAFTFKEVMDKLVAQSGVSGLTSLGLYRQWWDTQNTKPGLNLGAHCDDTLVGGQPALNGFRHQCPRAEGSQASEDPFASATAPQSYMPTALVNRFDLAPSTGAHCGEYRIVFARRSGETGGGRNFIIFEAVLPNPRLDLGIEGCRRVLNFWSGLATKTLAERATALKSFYFTGLSGFSPVVHIDNYGNATTRPTGQIRTNQFMDFSWNLREFKVKKRCVSSATGTTCALRFVPASDKVNPFGELFKPGSTQPLAAEFQTAFINSVPSLARNDINRFNYTVTNKFNAGESDAQTLDNVYTFHFGTGASTFRTNIQNKLSAIGSSLTPDHIVARAQALSCAGCHQQSVGADLGGGLVWPQSAGFVHVSEDKETGPEGQRFVISPALTSTFLPRRKVVMENILNRPVRDASFVSQTVPTNVTAGQTFNVTITLKNTGTTAWTEVNRFRLASESPADNTRWGKNRVLLGSKDKIHLGKSKSFTFSVTAPTVPGTYAFRWRMIQDSATPVRFGALTPAVSIVVQ